MALKWNRKKPGCYVSGVWTIKGSGTSWELFHVKDKVGESNSKKALQGEAQAFEDAPEDKESEEPEEESTVTSVVASQPKERAQKSSYGLESTLSSLRLEIDSLKYSNNALTVQIEKLTDAILLLAKHVK